MELEAALADFSQIWCTAKKSKSEKDKPKEGPSRFGLFKKGTVSLPDLIHHQALNSRQHTFTQVKVLTNPLQMLATFRVPLHLRIIVSTPL